jgi:hypothetical protein
MIRSYPLAAMHIISTPCAGEWGRDVRGPPGRLRARDRSDHYICMQCNLMRALLAPSGALGRAHALNFADTQPASRSNNLLHAALAHPLLLLVSLFAIFNSGFYEYRGSCQPYDVVQSCPLDTYQRANNWT